MAASFVGQTNTATVVDGERGNFYGRLSQTAHIGVDQRSRVRHNGPKGESFPVYIALSADVSEN